MTSKFQSRVASKAAKPMTETNYTTDTPPARPPVREEDPRARAAARAAQIRDHIGDLDGGTDEFYIPASYVPDGWTYEWKRRTIFNQEDPAYTVQLAQEGWEPVPANRHPEMMPTNWDKDTIERKGMILMERPREISEEIRQIELRRARQQVRIKEAQLSGTPDGTLTREHDRVRPNIKKSFDMPIPEDL